MEKIYVAGHRGMVGSAIVRTLEQQGQANFVTRTHAELDLTNQAAVQSHINVGFGDDITIKELAQAVGKTVGYLGVIDFDASKPDGSPRKLMDSSRLNALGWQAQVGLKAGLAAAYQDFMSQLLAEESSFLKSQTVTSIPSLRAQRGNPSPSPTQP